MNVTEFHAMDLADLFAQIGGFLGLFIGASMITMFEFFEYLVSFLVKWAKSLVVKRVQHRSGPSSPCMTDIPVIPT